MVRRALKEIPPGMRHFRKRLVIVPFDTALALTAVWSGLGAFFDASIQARLFNDALPDFAAILFNIVYIVSGLAVLAGIGWAYRNLEISGWILLLTSLIVRTISLWSYGGFNPFVTASLVQGAIFGTACEIKIYYLLKRKVIVLADSDSLVPTGEFHVPGDK